MESMFVNVAALIAMVLVIGIFAYGRKEVTSAARETVAATIAREIFVAHPILATRNVHGFFDISGRASSTSIEGIADEILNGFTTNQIIHLSLLIAPVVVSASIRSETGAAGKKEVFILELKIPEMDKTFFIKPCIAHSIVGESAVYLATGKAYPNDSVPVGVPGLFTDSAIRVYTLESTTPEKVPVPT